MGNLVEIVRFFDPEEAFCAQGFLRARGIETYLQNEHLLSMAPHMRIAVNGYGLMSFADQEYAARQALEEISNGGPATDAETAPDASESYPSRKNWFWLPTFFFFGAWPFLPRVRSRADVILQGAVIGVLYLLIYLIYFHPNSP